MGANELRAQLTSKIKVLQKRLNSLDWQATQIDATDGSLTVRERGLLDDLAAARIVLHDQELLITSVLVALRSALGETEARYEKRIRDQTVRYEEKISHLERTLQKQGEDHVKNVADSLAEAKAEYDNQLSIAQKEKCELEEKVAVLQQHLHKMQNKQSDMVEEALKQTIEKHELELAAMRQESEAAMAVMAAESSEIQLALKREHASLRSETASLREKLMMEKEHRENADKRAQVDVEAQLHEALRAAREDIETEYKEKMQASEEALNQEIQDFKKEIQALYDEKMRIEGDNFEANRACQELRDQMQQAQERSAMFEDRVHQLENEMKEGQERSESTKAAEIAEILEKQERQNSVERTELELKMSELEKDLGKMKALLVDKEAMLQAVLMKEEEAKALVLQYGEMTDFYRDLMGKHAPGLGAGLFLEKAIRNRSSMRTNH